MEATYLRVYIFFLLRIELNIGTCDHELIVFAQAA